jgi:hypothetical protein
MADKTGNPLRSFWRLDAARAKSFGYETYWASRLNLPVEELGVEPDAIGSGAAGIGEIRNSYVDGFHFPRTTEVLTRVSAESSRRLRN